MKLFLILFFVGVILLYISIKSIRKGDNNSDESDRFYFFYGDLKLLNAGLLLTILMSSIFIQEIFFTENRHISNIISSSIFLLIGIINFLLIFVVTFSKRFREKVWKFFKISKEKNKNVRSIVMVFGLLAFMGFFGFYLFSEIFLYWP